MGPHRGAEDREEGASGEARRQEVSQSRRPLILYAAQRGSASHMLLCEWRGSRACGDEREGVELLCVAANKVCGAGRPAPASANEGRLLPLPELLRQGFSRGFNLK